ncbi:uncharacterized protein LOC131954384 [Physella acuta]|uniref:uncharacterized protein LOC131954384 n=1 Tax=Physella acuta TaxID=109671 RepID=UPI0027DC5002|nr:uncharacterized protein LOC131954384 [Physella acuta]XP_059173998.1 uncharacterized protein LOC131954384 [Physella acuta]
MGAIRLVQLLACLLFLTEVVCQNTSFVAVIVGLERDCINHYCRYTGRIFGHFWHPYNTKPMESDKPCISLVAQECHQLSITDCNRDPYLWVRACVIWTYCPSFRRCQEHSIEDTCSCKTGSPHSMAVNLYEEDLLRAIFFRVAFVIDETGEIFALSNVYSIRRLPEDFDPLYLDERQGQGQAHGPEHVNTVLSRNGNPQLHADSICAHIGTVCAIGLATLLF